MISPQGHTKFSFEYTVIVFPSSRYLIPLPVDCLMENRFFLRSGTCNTSVVYIIMLLSLKSTVPFPIDGIVLLSPSLVHGPCSCVYWIKDDKLWNMCIEQPVSPMMSSDFSVLLV